MWQDHVDRVILTFVKAVMRFVTRAVGPMFGKGKGSFHVFALDFVVGADMQPKFLEANEAPAICSRNEVCSAWHAHCYSLGSGLTVAQL